MGASVFLGASGFCSVDADFLQRNKPTTMFCLLCLNGGGRLYNHIIQYIFEFPMMQYF